LQSVLHLVDAPEAAKRINTAVDEIDGAISDLRAAIFSLHAGAEQPLSATVRGLVGVVRHQLGFTPKTRFEGPVDSDVPEQVRIEVLAMLREALSNAARHARAHRVEVVLAVADEHLVMTVTDDGRGVPPGASRRGLANLAARAEALGGTFTLTGVEPSGTELRWHLPL
jgi:signal transduction histidine kinase